jgi:hypothetical protein
MGNFSFVDGGTVVQYNLAKIITDLGHNVRIYSTNKIPNPVFSKFYDNDFPIDDNAVVIYCEGTQGNPLNAKNVVRWLLSELGKNVPYDWVNGWGKDELVYFFNYDKIFSNNLEMVGTKYKLLTNIYINPLIKNYNNPLRKGFCHTFRKYHYHKTLRYAHPPNSYEIIIKHKLVDCINIFNKHVIFISYDPLTFLSVMAALCGCISVVIKVDGKPTQADWLKSTAVGSYAKDRGIEKLYGIAYGLGEIDWARKTLHLVSQQWIDILNYCKTNAIIPFLKDIEDLNNLENAENTIQKIFFDEDLKKLENAENTIQKNIF